MQNLKSFLSVLVLGPVLDFIWFSLVASDLYKREVGSILRNKIDFVPALVVYVLIALMVTFFVLPKVATGGGSIGTAFLWGALAGLILYGVYDFTNMSFLKDWTWTATFVDVLWGTVMVGVVSAVAQYLKALI